MLSIQGKELKSPCIYFFNKKGTPLYIGVRTKGMRRVFNYGLGNEEHRDQAMSLCDSVDILFFETEKRAKDEEAARIHQYHPEYNRFCFHCTFYRDKYPAQFKKPGQIFGKYRNAVLNLLLNNPERAYGIREIAHLTNLSLGAIQRELVTLEKPGILKRLENGKRVYYQAEERHPIYLELKSLVSKGA